ncbi:hypothetical protein LTS10_010564 [Elasticomyces elasticus]|nr:hypothetical protein LTS10_010564 [Elasticomyces elasticus]
MPDSNGIHIRLTTNGRSYDEHPLPTQPTRHPDESPTTRIIIQRRLPADRKESIRIGLYLEDYKMYSATALHIRVAVARRNDILIYDQVLLKADIKAASEYGEPFYLKNRVTMPDVEAARHVGWKDPWTRGWEGRVGFMVVLVERGRAVEKCAGVKRTKGGFEAIRWGDGSKDVGIGGEWRKLKGGPNVEATVFGVQVRGEGEGVRVNLERGLKGEVEVVDLGDEPARVAAKQSSKVTVKTYMAAKKTADKRKEIAARAGTNCETSKTSSGFLAGCAQDCDDEEGPPQKPAPSQPSAGVTKVVPMVTKPAVTRTVQQKTPLLDQVLHAGRAEQAATVRKSPTSISRTGGLRLTVKAPASKRRPEVIELDNEDTSDEEHLFVSEQKNLVPKQKPLPLPDMLQSNVADILAREKVEPPKQLVSSTIPSTVAFVQSPKPASQDAVRETASGGERKDIAVKPKGIVPDGQALVAQKPNTTVPAEGTSLMAATMPFAGFGGSNNPILVQTTWPNVQTATTITAKDNAVENPRPAIPAKLASTPQFQQQPAKPTEQSTTVPAQPPKPVVKDPVVSTTPSKEPTKVAEPKQKAEASVPTPDTNALKRKAAVMEEAADLEDELNDEMAEIELEKRAIEVKRRLRGWLGGGGRWACSETWD